MRFVLTAHAVDRWRERVDPGASFLLAEAALSDLVARATRCGTTRRGEVAYALDHAARPVALVRHRGRLSDKRGPGERPTVVTVLPAEQWRAEGESFDPEAELLAAYEDLQPPRRRDRGRAPADRPLPRGPRGRGPRGADFETGRGPPARGRRRWGAGRL